MVEPTFCSGLADLASRYRGFIVDQWGVLHDGATPYPEALEGLAELRAAGKRVVVLSNSGKRAAINEQRLAGLGIAADLYDALVTSGEATWQALARRSDPVFAGLGRRCVLWSRTGDRSLVDDQGLEVVADLEQADFLLLGGVEDDARLEQFTAALEQAAARDLPMICANPDVIAVQPGGGFGIAPGAVARHYEDLGGRVVYIGKPHRPVYELCLETLAPLLVGRDPGGRRFGRPRHRRRRRHGPRDRADHGRHPRAAVRPGAWPQRQCGRTRPAGGGLWRPARLGPAALSLALDRRADPLLEHVADDRQAVVAEIDLAVEDEARHAEHARRQGVADRRLQDSGGCGIVECRREACRIEPDLARDLSAGRVVEGRDAIGKKRLEQPPAEAFDRAEAAGSGGGKREPPGLEAHVLRLAEGHAIVVRPAAGIEAPYAQSYCPESGRPWNGSAPRAWNRSAL